MGAQIKTLSFLAYIIRLFQVMKEHQVFQDIFDNCFCVFRMLLLITQRQWSREC